MTAPLSSPWVITMTPMERVVRPHEFCQAWARVASSVSNSMPNILRVVRMVVGCGVVRWWCGGGAVVVQCGMVWYGGRGGVWECGSGGEGW